MFTPLASSNSIFPQVPAPEMVCTDEPPLSKIFPVPECVVVIFKFPFTVIVFPLSASVPLVTVRLFTVIGVPKVFVTAPARIPKCP
jgi:hypothetical protein